MGGYLRLVEKYDDFEYSEEKRDAKAEELVKAGKIVECAYETCGYPVIYVYEIINHR